MCVSYNVECPIVPCRYYHERNTSLIHLIHFDGYGTLRSPRLMCLELRAEPSMKNQRSRAQVD